MNWIRALGISLVALLANLSAAHAENAKKPRTDLHGDPLPPGTVARLGTIRFRHAGQVTSVASSRDGRLLATGGYDEAIRVWQASSGKALFRFALQRSHAPWPDSVAFSPDGALLAGSKSGEGSIHLWDTASGKERTKLKIADGPTATSITFSPDGTRMAAICWTFQGRASHSRSRLWRVKTGKEIEGFEAPAGTIWSISLDGRLLVSGHKNSTVLIWDVPSLWSPSQRETALTKERLDALWTQLGSDPAKQAYQALAVLSQTPADTLPMLRQRLRPAKANTARSISGLIDDLDSDTFALREKASRELAARGEAAGPAMRAALEAEPSPEVRRRLKEILEKMSSTKVHELRTDEEKRVLRAIAVLEEIGTPEARRILENLAGGAAAPETRAAQQALQRLK